MRRSSWKRVERRVAEAVGGRRIPCPGRAGPDVDHALFSIEVKSRSSLPKYLYDWLRQAEQGAPAGRRPVVVLHRAGGRHADDLALLRLDDLIGLVNQLGGCADG